MTFTDDEIRALAAFLARRLTPDLRPTDPTDAPTYGDSPLDQWERALRRAQATGRVSGLFRSAAKALPGDPALAEASALLDANRIGDRVRAGSVLAMAGAAMMLVAFGGLVTSAAMLAFGGIGGRTVAANEPRPHAEQVDGEQVSVEQVQIDEMPTLPVPSQIVSAIETLADSVQAPLPRTDDSGAEALRVAASGRGPCQTDGWFYAGTQRPHERFVAKHPLFVRAEPPSKENGWNSHAPVRCWLGRGDIVRLADAPLELPGHHYWIHLSPENVTRPVDVAME